jgi:glycosyltransferase involved in cell wall biosynthesis
MKVLAVIDGLALGGAENLLSTLGRVGPRHDLHISVLSLGHDTGSTATWLDVLHQAGLSVEFLGLTRLREPGGIPRLARAIRRADPDVVHAHLEDSATLAPLATRLTGHACVSTYHHVAVPRQGRKRWRERLSIGAANRGERVLFVSAASRDSFAAIYGGPRPHWQVVHNGVELDRFTVPVAGSGPALPAGLGIPEDVPVVTVLGRLGTGKGQAVAVAAWPRVLERVPDAHLLLVGDGPLESDLRRQVDDLGLHHRVVFAGRRRDAERIMSASTLTCLPTIREALPTALIEAAACGVPAVASATSGVLEVVDDGRTGLLFPYGDERRLADAVVALLEDDPRRSAMGTAARRLAERRFDAEIWADQLHAVYQQARDQAARGWPSRLRSRSALARSGGSA